jgi:phosphate transport system protein
MSDKARQLFAEVVRMGGMAETQVSDCVAVLARRDAPKARDLIARDADLDALESQIEQRAVALITEAPPEDMLRQAVSAMKLAMNLERCGDLARNIAKRSLILDEGEPTSIMRAVQRMGQLVAQRLADAVEAYAASDLELALSVWNRDDEVDDHYEGLFAGLIDLMQREPGSVGAGAHLLFIAKNLERIGDHATNIAEIVHHQITGRELTGQRPRWSRLDADQPPAEKPA